MEDNCKLSKLDRRLMKKTNRKKHILYKNDGIKYVNSCTKVSSLKACSYLTLSFIAFQLNLLKKKTSI